MVWRLKAKKAGFNWCASRFIRTYFTYAHRSQRSIGHQWPLAISLCSGLLWSFSTSWSLVVSALLQCLTSNCCEAGLSFSSPADSRSQFIRRASFLFSFLVFFFLGGMLKSASQATHTWLQAKKNPKKQKTPNPCSATCGVETQRQCASPVRAQPGDSMSAHIALKRVSRYAHVASGKKKNQTNKKLLQCYIRHGDPTVVCEPCKGSAWWLKECTGWGAKDTRYNNACDALKFMHQGPVSWRPTTVKWRQFSQSYRHSTIGTRQTEYHEALPSAANDEVRCDCTFVDDGNAS